VALGCTHGWGGFPITFIPDRANGVSREAYVDALIAEGVPVAPGPVRVPLHCRPEVVFRWGEQPACPVAEYRCACQEIWLRGAIGWIGDHATLVKEVAGAFLKVHECLDELRISEDERCTALLQNSTR